MVSSFLQAVHSKVETRRDMKTVISMIGEFSRHGVIDLLFKRNLQSFVCFIFSIFNHHIVLPQIFLKQKKL